MSESVATPVAADRPPARERSYWAGAWHELRTDRSALVGLAIVCLLALTAALAPLVAPYDPSFQHTEGLSLEGEPLGPSSEFLLGTDALGRDELSRIVYGARVSLVVGVGANLLAAVFGLAIGGTAGLARSRLQAVIMRSLDVVLSFPILLLAIALLTVTERSVTTIIGIIGVVFGAIVSRIVFAQAVSLREREFVLAARAAGVRSGWILVRHVVPHVLPSVLVWTTLGAANAIQLEAALSFVGIGIQPPEASWGNMISEGQVYIRTAPWLVLFPGGAIMLAMVGFSLLGDGLRDALDPTLERRTRLFGFGGLR